MLITGFKLFVLSTFAIVGIYRIIFGCPECNKARRPR